MAFNLPRSAAGDPFQEGLDAFYEDAYEAAMAAWLPLAESGDPEAAYNVGLLYELGYGVPADQAAAVEWYISAAEGGQADAQLRIGDLYLEGYWGKDETEDAAVWYRYAADQGLEEAVARLEALGQKVAAEPSQATPDPESEDTSEQTAHLAPIGTMGICEAQQDRDFKVHVSLSIPSAPIDHSLSASELTARTFHSADSQVLGLMSPDLEITTASTHATQTRDDLVCFWLESIDVELTYKSIEVYIAREYKRGSCEYKAVLRHEREHLRIARDNLERFKPRVRAALTSLLIPTPDRPVQLKSADDAEEQYDALFQRILQPVYGEMLADLDAAQGKIDTPKSYARVRRKCNNW